MTKQHLRIDHAEFIALLSAEFPEVVAFDRSQRGLLHGEMGAFRRMAERAMDRGHLWRAQQYFRFIERVLQAATPDVENAVAVSFLKDLALGEFTPARYHAVKDRMPRRLRDRLLAVNERWK